MLCCCTSSCTSSHTWCYAAVRRLALPHIYDATLVYVVLHFLTYMMQLHCMSSCTSSHIIGIQPYSMARFGRMFALGSGDGKTVPTKTSASSLQKLWRTLSAEKKRVPLSFFTYPVKVRAYFLRKLNFERHAKNHCDLWYEINDEHCKRSKRGLDKQPAG